MAVTAVLPMSLLSPPCLIPSSVPQFPFSTCLSLFEAISVSQSDRLLPSKGRRPSKGRQGPVYRALNPIDSPFPVFDLPLFPSATKAEENEGCRVEGRRTREKVFVVGERMRSAVLRSRWRGQWAAGQGQTPAGKI